MPANLDKTEKILSNLPKDNVFILDQISKELEDYSAIYQNFKKDIFKGLTVASNKIEKYNKLVLLFSESKQPVGILNGFTAFCQQSNLKYEIIDALENRTPVNGELYLILNDKDLIRIIKKIKENQLVLAKEIGVISFNDTLLKEFVEGGITTISTDFKLMGKNLAKMILSEKSAQIENPSSLILRKSI